jgi:hypothetical protein
MAFLKYKTGAIQGKPLKRKLAPEETREWKKQYNFKLNLPRTSIYLFLKAAADKTIYRTAGKFIGRGPSPISLTA